ncbi:hypothetical protein AVEN_27366-1 [Araneus ventricosus]|uniref:Uncharacterized protein n=1 Tax=Araneus ventricosus TaxID=182803 RepID=A0A4Y2IRZ0_ARAVE|nr:hypothetical protein AVEN_27366-1 [Araneus ventricosus]
MAVYGAKAAFLNKAPEEGLKFPHFAEEEMDSTWKDLQLTSPIPVCLGLDFLQKFNFMVDLEKNLKFTDRRGNSCFLPVREDSVMLCIAKRKAMYTSKIGMSYPGVQKLWEIQNAAVWTSLAKLPEKVSFVAAAR